MSEHSAWLDRLRASAQLPPAAPRVPLWWGTAVIGSVEPDFFAKALPAQAIGVQGWVEYSVRDGQGGWALAGELTSTLALIANALRHSGFAHTWRDEQLAVCDEHGTRLGTVERGVVRQLGITTHAVHLAGVTPDGRHWIQQRSLTKANDPGLWDTLMGGMVPASDTVMQSLERETWEEAGLRIDQLREIELGGRIATSRPAHDQVAGYVVEDIDWYRCVVPDGVAPSNQDGEVAQFALLPQAQLHQRLLQGEFTTEAALIFAAMTGIAGI
ncbi:NUDIX domain-containing protein [Caenimonas koreensis DSM 17982]|uniref:NUDIX domain-containing protein n=1 Tax=Caenimonas koreensis DSM 17982 TaxID=1121255 RepID=A0A844AQA3_9BURK|nr:NUDIX domain-containing protein [Caenimonas koreensis]MRD46174.1 NUDIX domain-containing protein [Caenimonas koreensis DSM 17982]